TLRTRHPEGGWAAPRLGHPEGVGCGNGAQLAQRVSQLAAERTPDSPGGTAPPVAGLRDNGAAPRGGKLSRSLRSLRPIAAASVVAGPRWFPEGAWIHRRGGPATTPGPVPEGGWTTPKTRHPQGVGPHSGPGTPTGVGPHPRPSTPRGLGHTQDPAPRRRLDHTQDQAPPGGWATLRTRHPEGGWTTPKAGHPQGVGCGNGAQLAQRVSQLTAERTPD